MPKHEHKAFIPFTNGFLAKAPPGSTSIINAKATKVLQNQIVLDTGEPIDYDYLILATGSKLSPPGSLTTRTKQEGISYFQNHQALISQANEITLIGGGAVGVRECCLFLDGLHRSLRSDTIQKWLQISKIDTPKNR